MTTHHDDPRRVARDEDRAWFDEQDKDRRVWSEVYP